MHHTIDTDQATTTIREWISIIISKWHYFFIAQAILLPIVIGYLYFATEWYLTRASILLDDEVQTGLGHEKFLNGMDLSSSNTGLQDEIGLLKSYSLTSQVIQKLDFGITYYSKSGFRSVERYGAHYPFKIVLDSTVNQITNVPILIKVLPDSTYSIQVAKTESETYNFNTNKNTGRATIIAINSTHSTTLPFSEVNLAFAIRIDEAPVYSDTEYFFVIQNLNALAEAYQNALDIKPISRASSLVEVGINSKNQQKGELFINTLLEVYRNNELDNKNQLGIKTIGFIDHQLSGVSDELQQAEKSLEFFRSKNDHIINVTTTEANLTKKLDKLETQKSQLEQRLNYYKYIAAGMARENTVNNVNAHSSFGFVDPLLNNLLTELASLNQERSVLSIGMKEGNPTAGAVELKIANTKTALVNNVNNFIEASNDVLLGLNTSIREIKSKLHALPGSERELVSITRNFDFNDHVYNYLLKKKAEAGIAIASNTVEKSIVDYARPVGVGPISPDRRTIILIAFLFGLIVPVGAIAFKNHINDTIGSVKDVEKSTPIPILGTIYRANKADQSSPMVAHAKSALGESFRSLRTNLQYLTLGTEPNVIGITSSVDSEGKTFCAVNLAATMAESGKKTIIIDSDMRRPRMASMFGLKNDKGLSNYLIGSCSLNDIINSSGVKGLDVITSGVIPPNPLDLIGLPKMEELIGVLKTKYTTIIIDSPPMEFVSDYIILMKYANTTVYIVRSNRTTRNYLEKINRLYKEEKVKNISILLNDVKNYAGGYNYIYG